MVVEPSSDGFQLVYGLATAVTLKHLSRVKVVRRARLWKESPPDLPGRLIEVDSLRWRDLTLEEKQQCSPLLVFADESALTQQSLGELSILLTSDLPVKIVLLDSCDVRKSRVEPALIASAHQCAFVLCASLAYREHLVAGLNRALAFPGSALIHIHAPLPSEHGFPPSKTIERARAAVESRVHPLFTYDPSSDGVFGVRATIDGNPGVDDTWGGTSFLDWALGETRFKSGFRRSSEDENVIALDDYLELTQAERTGKTPSTEDSATGETLLISDSLIRAVETRQQIWKVYREITGKESPFVNLIRSDLIQQVEAAQRQGVEAMKKEYEARIDEIKRDVDGKLANQLRDRLLSLAGFDPNPPQSGNE